MSNKNTAKRRFSGATVKRLMKYIVVHNKGMFAISCLCIVIACVADVSGSIFIQNIIDEISSLIGSGSTALTEILKFIIMMAAVYVIGVICTYVYSKLMVYVSQRSLKDIRDDMFNHMQSLPIRYFDTNTHGDIMSHYTNDTDTLRQFISQVLPQVFSCALTVIASFCIMLYYSWLLSLVVVAVTVVVMLLTGYISKRSTHYFVRQQSSLAKVNGYIEEMFNGQKVIKVFCHEQKSEQGFDENNDNLYEDTRRANRFGNVLMPLLNQIGNLQYVILAVIGGAMVISGWNIGGAAIEVGTVVAFLSLSKSFSMPIQQISNQISMISMALAGADRIFRLIDQKPEVDDGYVTLVNAEIDEEGNITECERRTGKYAWKHPHHDGTLTYTQLKGEVRMFDVDFGYTPEKLVLHDVTVYAEPGQKVAFVGATGAGKTTITNLINRFYDIADGKIRYDGININKIKKADLRRSLGIVLQDTFLFTGTVMENIRYGRLDATDEECIAAAKLANADDFISRLPDGYNTMLYGAGAGLSQGQRQLIAIARAAVADPPAMILDEATSSIDTRTEKMVQAGMDSLMDGRTTFVIAHRLSTIQNSDVIMVLDHGRIIERGNHDRLIEKHGVYYQLYTGAFELE